QHDALVVYFIMLEEALPPRREKSFLAVLGNGADPPPYPPLVLFEHLRKAFAAPVEHDARAGKFHSLELRMIRQIGGCFVVEKDKYTEGHPRPRDFLVSSQLPVCRLQIGKIDAVKSLILAGDRLWVIHGSCDEVLDVDVFDVECLAHVRTARAQ